jgi:hypothetical protein
MRPVSRFQVRANLEYDFRVPEACLKCECRLDCVDETERRPIAEQREQKATRLQEHLPDAKRTCCCGKMVIVA